MNHAWVDPFSVQFRLGVGQGVGGIAPVLDVGTVGTSRYPMPIHEQLKRLIGANVNAEVAPQETASYRVINANSALARSTPVQCRAQDRILRGPRFLKN